MQTQITQSCQERNIFRVEGLIHKDIEFLEVTSLIYIGPNRIYMKNSSWARNYHQQLLPPLLSLLFSVRVFVQLIVSITLSGDNFISPFFMNGEWKPRRQSPHWLVTDPGRKTSCLAAVCEPATLYAGTGVCTAAQHLATQPKCVLTSKAVNGPRYP